MASNDPPNQEIFGPASQEKPAIQIYESKVGEYKNTWPMDNQGKGAAQPTKKPFGSMK